MVSKEKARQSCGPIPEHVLEDTSEYATSKLHLQVFRLNRCCAISAAMAAMEAAGATVALAVGLDAAIAQLEAWGLLRGVAT